LLHLAVTGVVAEVRAIEARMGNPEV
jgi:hypothetical protein